MRDYNSENSKINFHRWGAKVDAPKKTKMSAEVDKPKQTSVWVAEPDKVLVGELNEWVAHPLGPDQTSTLQISQSTFNGTK